MIKYLGILLTICFMGSFAWVLNSSCTSIEEPKAHASQAREIFPDLIGIEILNRLDRIDNQVSILPKMKKDIEDLKEKLNDN